jgi:beta-ribofuranosylaminobenzene 5'-phosphate synthase
MPRFVRVAAPSRLHFGLWSLGTAAGRRFGGVGAMIEQPELRLSIEEAHDLQAAGKASERALEFAGRWAAFHRLELPRCRIDVQAMIPAHAGLGSGTQLALSVAAALNAYCRLPSQTPQELASSVGRGLRSAVGTYGFVFGGLVVEQGKLPDESISPLDCRIDLPEDWRFVLIRVRGLSGLAGHDEADAFNMLPEVPASVSEQLIAETRDRLVPAAATGDSELFAESLYRYGRRSGECFATRQGGPYNGPRLTALVQRIVRLGHAGVGQSSWGPTIFVAEKSQQAAEQLLAELRAGSDSDELDLMISRPCNRGARIEACGDTIELVQRH